MQLLKKTRITSAIHDTDTCSGFFWSNSAFELPFYMAFQFCPSYLQSKWQMTSKLSGGFKDVATAKELDTVLLTAGLEG
jgi:hypothetical protein